MLPLIFFQVYGLVCTPVHMMLFLCEQFSLSETLAFSPAERTEMNIRINNINENLKTLTFRHLKKMMPGTGKRKLLTYKALSRLNPQIAFEVEENGLLLTVYENGYFTCEKEEHVTVYAVDRCNCIKYRFDDGTSMTVEEDEYADSSWFFPLSVIGDQRLEDNFMHRESYQEVFSYSSDVESFDFINELSVPDYPTQLEEKEQEESFNLRHKQMISFLETAFKELTDKQKKCIELHFGQNKTYREIGKILGIDHAAVVRSVQGGIKKLQKLSKKYF